MESIVTEKQLTDMLAAFETLDSTGDQLRQLLRGLITNSVQKINQKFDAVCNPTGEFQRVGDAVKAGRQAILVNGRCLPELGDINYFKDMVLEVTSLGGVDMGDYRFRPMSDGLQFDYTGPNFNWAPTTPKNLWDATASVAPFKGTIKRFSQKVENITPNTNNLFVGQRLRNGEGFDATIVSIDDEHTVTTDFVASYNNNGGNGFVQPTIITIATYKMGDDFSNIAKRIISGTINTAGCVFESIGGIANTWANDNTGSLLSYKGYYADNGVLTDFNEVIIITYQAGDDFTRSGAASNANKVIFTPNIKTPLWLNGSVVKNIGGQQTGGNTWTSNDWIIEEYAPGDDFTNVGGINASGTIFHPSGDTPADWTHGSKLRIIYGVANGPLEINQNAPQQCGLALHSYQINASGATTGDCDIDEGFFTSTITGVCELNMPNYPRFGYAKTNPAIEFKNAIIAFLCLHFDPTPAACHSFYQAGGSVDGIILVGVFDFTNPLIKSNGVIKQFNYVDVTGGAIVATIKTEIGGELHLSRQLPAGIKLDIKVTADNTLIDSIKTNGGNINVNSKTGVVISNVTCDTITNEVVDDTVLFLVKRTGDAKPIIKNVVVV